MQPSRAQLPDLDLGWLEEIEPQRTEDDNHSGCATESFVSTAGDVETHHLGRIEGRLRSRLSLWRQLTSDRVALDLIEDGLRLPLLNDEWPPHFHDDCNHVPSELDAWLDDQIVTLRRAGAICTRSEHAKTLRARGQRPGPMPHMVSPLIVSEKPSSTPSNRKYRLIHDLRELNKYLRKQKFKLENLPEFFKQLRKGDYLWSADLASAYFHVSIQWDFIQLLGFRHRGVYYVFCVLPFGLTTSAWAVRLVSGVAAAGIRECGLVDALCHYVDDFIGSTGSTRDHKRALTAIKFLTDLGFALNPDKLRLVLTRILEGLGHVLNTGTMTVTITARRRERMVAAADAAWSHRSRVSARSVARITGHALAASLAYGLDCKLFSRYLLRWVAETARDGNYDHSCALTGRALLELDRWRHKAREFGEQPMQPHLKEATWVLRCDASESAAACIVSAAPPPRRSGVEIHRTFTRAERDASSTLREMWGYEHAVRALASQNAFTPTDVIEIVGDSRCAAAIFAKGGSQAAFDENTGELQLLEALLGIFGAAACEVRFRWTRRCNLTDADALSKYVDRMDFGLKPSALRRVLRSLGTCDIDRFAASHNKVCERFNSLFLAEGSEAADAFGVCWSEGASFILPEFSPGFINRALDKIERDNAIATCIMPWWPSKPFWHRINSGAWSGRIAARLTLPPDSLVVHWQNAEHCFFGTSFESPLLAFRTRRV